MVELRKRKTPPPPAPAPAKKAKAAPKAKAESKQDKTAATTTAAAATTSTVAEAPEAPSTSAPRDEEKKAAQETPAAADKSATGAKGQPKGATIKLDGFGGIVQTQAGEDTTLARLVAASSSGVVLFTYPKASTPGCTTQACLFRDAHAPLTATGLAIYGLSRDSPKANASFKARQSLPYPLLCDPKATLITAIGLAKGGAGSGTTRGVFVVDKTGRVLANEAGGPAATVEVVKRLVEEVEAK